MRLLAAVAAVALGAPAAAQARPDASVVAQESKAHHRHPRRTARAHWARVARPYRSWLAAMTWCESGGDGHYRLRTTGNGFWFAAQFTPSTWASVGGRTRDGAPVGRWGGRVPSRPEVDYRAVRVRWSQGTGAWPVCG